MPAATPPLPHSTSRKDLLKAVVVGLGFQLFLLLLSLVMLNGGYFTQCVILSMAAWWAMLLIMGLARRKATLGDLMAIRYGFLVILTLILVGRLLLGKLLS